MWAGADTLAGRVLVGVWARVVIMDEPFSAYCKLGIVHFMAFGACMQGDGPIVETVMSLAADPDFEVIEVGHINDPAARRQVRAVADEAGVELAYAAQPVVLMNKLDLNSLDSGVRQRAVDALRAELDLACEMEVIGFGFLSGPDPGEAHRLAAVEALVDSCDKLCEHAAGLGDFPVLLETFDRDVDKRALVGPNSVGAEIAVRLGRDNFGLMIDLSHLPLQGESVGEALAAAGSHLKHAHMGNCFLGRQDDPAYGDQHPRFGYPGSEIGVPELSEYLRGLKEVGYLNRQKRSVVSFEVKPAAGERAELVIANAKRTLREAWLRV